MSSAMNNTNISSLNETRYVYTEEIDWIIPIAINSLLVISTLWILISLIHYGVKTGKWRQVETSNLEKLNTGMVYSSLILCALMCICRYIVAYVHMSVGFFEGQDEVCDSLSDATSTFYSLVLVSSALFYWFRQRIFYSNSMLNVNYTPCVRFFSFASIIVIIVCGLAVLIFSTALNDHPWSERGCTYAPDDSLRIYYWVSIVFAIGFGQVSLMCLFIHALRRTSMCGNSTAFIKKPRRFSRKNSELSKSVDTDVEQLSMSAVPVKKEVFQSSKLKVTRSAVTKPATKSNKKRPVDPVKTILKKTLFFAVASLVVDIVIQVFSLFISEAGNHRRVSTTLLSASAFLSLLFLIFSFNQYKEMLFSPFYRRK